MSDDTAAAANADRGADLAALASTLRPELHRYCARLMASVIDGEDVVQDTLERALAALPVLDAATPLRPWLFRIAHNRALDVLIGRELRRAEPIDAAAHVADTASPDPMEALMQRQAVATAVSRFAALPLPQRSVVVLKDVLGESLADVAALLDLSVDAVKAHLARGRARLREIDREALPASAPPAPSPALLRYVDLFNHHDWDGLRALLADDVKLRQSDRPLRAGRAEVGMFFNFYAREDWGVWLAPAWLEGREAIAVFDRRGDAVPGYFMWLEWRGGRIAFIHDYRYVRYVAADAELVLVADADRPTAAP